MLLFNTALVIIFALYLLSLWIIRNKNYFWYIPILITFATPIFLKLGVTESIYLHPSFPLLAGFVVVVAISNIRLLTRENIKGWLVLNKMSVGIALLFLVAVFAYGAVVGLLRVGRFDIGELMRSILYAGGFSILWINTWSVLNLKKINIAKIIQLFLAFIAVFAVIGIYRVASFALSGGVIDYWQYGPQYQAIATLGQYIDATGVHLINSGASESAGWLMALAAFACLVFIKHSYASNKLKSTGLYSILLILFIAALLFTLSRASIAMLFLGFSVFALVGFHRWMHRLVFGLVILVTTLGIIIIFPNAPFVSKSSSTVSITQQPSEDVKQASGSTSTSSATTSANTSRNNHIELELEPSAQGRVEYWKQSLAKYTESWPNSVFGVGLIDLRESYDLVTHSMLLQQMVKFGILGAISYMLIWLILCTQLFIMWRRHGKDEHVSLVLIPLMCITPGWMLSNLLFGASFFSFELLIIYFGLWGILYGAIYATRK